MAGDPTFDTSAETQVRRVGDYLEVGFQPALATDPVVMVRVPMASDVGGFTPNVTTARRDLFRSASGQDVSLVAAIVAGGGLPFETAAPISNATYKGLLRAARRGSQIVWRVTYGSRGGLKVQGRARVTDRGVQGGIGDISAHGFTVEAETADYIDEAGNVIV